MTLRLDDDESAALRRRAEQESRSMQEVTRQAVREYIENHSRVKLLDAVLDEQSPRYAEASGSVSDLPKPADLLHLAERVPGPDEPVRDHGLLESASARPQTTVFGADAYPTSAANAAALLHSVAGLHALVDGNERLALAATIVFLGVNGNRLMLTNDEAYALVMAVDSGELDEVDLISERLAVRMSERRPSRALLQRRARYDLCRSK